MHTLQKHLKDTQLRVTGETESLTLEWNAPWLLFLCSSLQSSIFTSFWIHVPSSNVLCPSYFSSWLSLSVSIGLGRLQEQAHPLVNDRNTAPSPRPACDTLVFLETLVHRRAIPTCGFTPQGFEQRTRLPIGFCANDMATLLYFPDQRLRNSDLQTLFPHQM